MGKKYIIEIGRLERLYKAFVSAHGKPEITWLSPEVDLTPYTEPDLEQVRKKAYDEGYADAKGGYENGFENGMIVAWDAARKIIDMPEADLLNLFTECYAAVCTSVQVFLKYDASECIEKIRQYEQKQEEIQVGDEVVGTYTGEEETEPFVIIRKIPDIDTTYYFGIYSKSGEFCQGGLRLKKTGRHFPEIAEVLAKMKEQK